MTQESTLYAEFLAANPSANIAGLDHTIPDHLGRIYDSRSQFTEFANGRMKSLIEQGKYTEADAVMGELGRHAKDSPLREALDGIAKKGEAAAASNINASRWSLPKGISAGKLTAYLAGAAVVAGAAYALWPKDKPEEVKKNTPSSWVDRVDQSRMQSNYVGH